VSARVVADSEAHSCGKQLKQVGVEEATRLRPRCSRSLASGAEDGALAPVFITAMKARAAEDERSMAQTVRRAVRMYLQAGVA
jgi:hypothetical protein